MTVRVVVADDQALVRAGSVSLIRGPEGLEVVAEAADGDQAATAAREHHPDIVLMDVRMPGVDGLEATRRIANDDALQETKVVMLTTYELDEYVFEALRAGASGFLTKDVDSFAGSGPAPRRTDLLDALTRREIAVLELVGRGLSNDEIGGELHMSPLTAKTHVSRTLSKLGLRDRAQLVGSARSSCVASPRRTRCYLTPSSYSPSTQ